MEDGQQCYTEKGDWWLRPVINFSQLNKFVFLNKVQDGNHLLSTFSHQRSQLQYLLAIFFILKYLLHKILQGVLCQQQLNKARRSHRNGYSHTRGHSKIKNTKQSWISIHHHLVFHHHCGHKAQIGPSFWPTLPRYMWTFCLTHSTLQHSFVIATLATKTQWFQGKKKILPCYFFL